MTTQKELDLGSLVDWGHDILKEALDTKGINEAVRAYAVYTGIILATNSISLVRQIQGTR